MVIYTHIHDVTIARFATDTNSEQTDRQKWYNDYYNYFNVKLPLVDTRIITKCVYNVIKNIKDFNGVSKCSPEDEFNSDIGNLFARNRLLSKYTKYKMIIARKISEEIMKDYEICRRISIVGYDPTIHDAFASLGLSAKEYE